MCKVNDSGLYWTTRAGDGLVSLSLFELFASRELTYFLKNNHYLQADVREEDCLKCDQEHSFTNAWFIRLDSIAAVVDDARKK